MSGLPPASPDDLDYSLPGSAIAQVPLARRDRARLLVYDRGTASHRRVCDLPELVGPGDLLVVNDTRVLPARLRLRRATGGAVEVLLVSERAGDEGNVWEALVRPSRRLRPGEIVTPPQLRGPPCGDPPQVRSTGRAGPPPGRASQPASPHPGGGHRCGPVEVEIGEDLGEGRRVVRIATGGRALLDVLEEIGEAPLPPYITGTLDDPDRYQTVYARQPRSAAAPTAGLHFTERLLERVRRAGAKVATVELVIGVDTFRPVTAARLDDHKMHTEQFRVPHATQAEVAAARRVVAVGTTVARCLETWADTGVSEGRTSLFIRRPYEWRAVDALMTNFHLPRSTLLCLLDAFIGPVWRDLYGEALSSGYRFLSFGDAMLATRAGGA